MTTRNPQQTRERLLQTAFEEIHAHGFQGMRVDEVLRQSGLQKGAFYHHFGSKAELGYAVLEERIRPLIESLWLEPLTDIKDPIAEFPQILDNLEQQIPAAMRMHGCPLNNLAQEMASQNEDFRQRIEKMFDHWLDGLEALFEHGKVNGYVREDVDSRAVASFILAIVEGSIGLTKVDQSPQHWAACRSQLESYLQTLRPQQN